MMDATVSVEILRKRIVDARAVGDGNCQQTALDAFVALGEQLNRALQRYGDMIAEAATYNTASANGSAHSGDGVRTTTPLAASFREAAGDA